MGKNRALRRRGAALRKKIMTPRPPTKKAAAGRGRTPSAAAVAAATAIPAAADALVAAAVSKGLSTEELPGSPCASRQLQRQLQLQKDTPPRRGCGVVQRLRNWVRCKRERADSPSSTVPTPATDSAATVEVAFAGGMRPQAVKRCRARSSRGGGDGGGGACDAAPTTTTAAVTMTTGDAATDTSDVGDVLAFLVLKKLDVLAESGAEMRGLVGALQAGLGAVADRVAGVADEVQTLRGETVAAAAATATAVRGESSSSAALIKALRDEARAAVRDSTGVLEDCIEREVLKATSRSRTMLRREQQVQNASARKLRDSSSGLSAAATGRDRSTGGAKATTLVCVEDGDATAPAATAAAEEDQGAMLRDLAQSLAELKATLRAVQADMRRGGGSGSSGGGGDGGGGSGSGARVPAQPQSFAERLRGDAGLAKYARMLSMGIPEQAIRNKMTMDGASLPADASTAAGTGAAPPPPPGMAPPPPPPGAAPAAPRGFAAQVHAGEAYAKYSRMLKMGIPEVAVKQKMTMDGIDWRAAFEGGGGGGGGGRKAVTVDALKGIKLKSAKQRKLAKKKVDNKPKVCNGQLQISEDMLKSIKLKSSGKPRKLSKAARKLKAAATAVSLCVAPGGFGMTLDALKSVKLRKSKRKAISPSKRQPKEKGSPKVLFQLKKTSGVVPRSPGGTPLASKAKRRMSMSILGQVTTQGNPDARSSPMRL